MEEQNSFYEAHQIALSKSTRYKRNNLRLSKQKKFNEAQTLLITSMESLSKAAQYNSVLDLLNHLLSISAPLDAIKIKQLLVICMSFEDASQTVAFLVKMKRHVKELQERTVEKERIQELDRILSHFMGIACLKSIKMK